MKKILIILICFCLLFPVNIILADSPLISQPIYQEFSKDVREGECIAQKWKAEDFQLDVNKISLYVTSEFDGDGIAGICNPDPLSGDPIFDEGLWLDWDNKPLSEMEGWVNFSVSSTVTEGAYYWLLFKIPESPEPPDVNAQVHGGLQNPYEDGTIWFFERGVGWGPIEPHKDIAFEIYGNEIVTPEVQTLDATHIEDLSAELWGQIIDDGRDDCEIRFELKEEGGNPWYPSDWDGSYDTNDKFNETVTDLDPGTKYLFRAGARNDRGTTWDDDWVSFTMDLDDRIPEHHAILIAPWITPRYPHYDEWWEPAFLLLERVLKDGGFQSKNIHTFYDEDATWQNINDTFTELNDDPWDTTLVVIGTHGANESGGEFQLVDGMRPYQDLNEFGLNHLNSAGVCVLIEACESSSAIDDLMKDGRIIWTDTSISTITQFAMALDEFADYTEFGDKNGTVSVEEAYNHIENYEQGIHVNFQDDYPSEANNDDELSITRQNWNDGRVDQLNGICCSTYGQNKYVNQWEDEEVTLKNKTAQEFYPVNQYDKLIKVRTEVRKTDISPIHNLLVSIRKEELESDDIGSKQISADDIVYRRWGEKYTTIKFDDSINIEHGMSSIPYFIVYSPTGTDEEFCKYLIHCSLYGSDYPYGNPYHCYYADGENDEWIEDTDRDIRFVTYGLNSTNMPPYTPKRPGGGLNVGYAWVSYDYYVNTTDIDDGDQVNYTIDWDDGTQTTTEQYDSGEVVCVSHKWVTDGKYHIKVKAIDSYGAESGWSDVRLVNILPNEPPNAPIIDGPTSGKAGEEYQYNFTISDPDGDSMYLRVDWGSGTPEPWIGPYDNGTTVKINHTWNQGTYNISAQAKDIHGAEGEWSTLEVTMPKFTSHGVTLGTHITMAPSGPVSQPIESLRVGDIISSYNPITQEVTIAEVTEIYVYTENLPERLIFNGNLEVTTLHTVHINGMEWVNAIDARVIIDNLLENIPSTPIIYPTPIISKVPSIGPVVPIYDLEIRPLYGEAIGYWANGILVGGYE